MRGYGYTAKEWKCERDFFLNYDWRESCRRCGSRKPRGIEGGKRLEEEREERDNRDGNNGMKRTLVEEDREERDGQKRTLVDEDRNNTDGHKRTLVDEDRNNGGGHKRTLVDEDREERNNRRNNRDGHKPMLVEGSISSNRPIVKESVVMPASDEYFVIERINDHRFEGSTVEFLVQWVGYTEQSWEPTTHFPRANPFVKDYVERNGINVAGQLWLDDDANVIIAPSPPFPLPSLPPPPPPPPLSKKSPMSIIVKICPKCKDPLPLQHESSDHDYLTCKRCRVHDDEKFEGTTLRVSNLPNGCTSAQLADLFSKKEGYLVQDCWVKDGEGYIMFETKVWERSSFFFFLSFPF